MDICSSNRLLSTENPIDNLLNNEEPLLSEKNIINDEQQDNVDITDSTKQNSSNAPTMSIENINNETQENEDVSEGTKEKSSAPSTGDVALSEDTKKYSSNAPTTALEDEDVVLAGDENTKEYDVNIDEDELLKDTDNDDYKNNSESNVEENESISLSGAVTIENEIIEQTSLDSNQNISTTLPTVTQGQENMLGNNVSEVTTNNENETVAELEDSSDSATTSSNNEDKLLSTPGLNDKVSSKSDDMIESLNQTESEESTCDNSTSNIVTSKVEDSFIDKVSSNSDNMTEELSQIESKEPVFNNLTSDIATTKDGVDNMDVESASQSNKTAKSSVGEEKSEDNDETKFLHVEQDNNRPDESFDVTENVGEDPFAQTTDEVMETSENSEKEVESDKPQSESITEPMEVDEFQSHVEGDVTSQNKSSSIDFILLESNQEDEADNLKKTDIPNDSVLVKNNQVSELNILKSSDVPNTSNTDNSQVKEPATNIEKDNNETSNNEQSKDVVQNDRTQSDDVCIIPENESKKITQTELEKVLLETTTVSSARSKPGRSSFKAKNRSRKSSSEDDSTTDEDVHNFEMGTKSGTRPKRNAAKKAESQIRVLSAVEDEVEQEDIDSNGVEEIPIEEESPADEQTPVLEETNSQLENEENQYCFICKKVGECKINVLSFGKMTYFCDDACFVTFRGQSLPKPVDSPEIVPPSTVIKDLNSLDIPPIDRSEFVRKCSQCSSVVKEEDEKTLSWETMDFCGEDCLGKYQQELGSHCANCKGNVQPASLGKYCVRFGYEVKQFCSSSCLEEFKKGLKVCSFCQKDISSGAEGFLAPVGDKGTFKDFCSQACMEKYEQMSSNQPPPPQTHICHVCNNNKLVEVEVFFDSKINKLCSDICFTAYKFANKLSVDRCDMCRKYFDKEGIGEKFNIFYEGVPHSFCCKTCMNVYILAKRKIVPCNWCKVKKYNFDMIKRIQAIGQVLMMCSLNCLTLYQVSVNAVSSRRIKCDMCLATAQAQYHLTMSDATIRNFCTYPCVMNFQQQYSKSPITLPGSDAPPIPTGAPKRILQKSDIGTPVPVISSVSSLANGLPIVNNTTPTLQTKVTSGKLTLVTRHMEPPICRNKSTQTRPIMNTKSVSCRPHSTSVEVQTEDGGKPVLIPIPVPIYVPCPMAMYSFPFPVPVPLPIPIPVPLFLPTTRNSIKGIIKEIKRIQEKVPADPFEAELLMMAEMVAEDKKDVTTSSDSETENDPAGSDTRPNSDGEGDFSPEAMETNNAFGEDIVEIALKMAKELDEPAEDLENQLTPATILNQTQSENDEKSGDTEKSRKVKTGENRARKRTARKSPQKRSGSSDRKKRKSNHTSEEPISQAVPAVEEPKPDANMKLKYTFGVNAWKSWVVQKNSEIEAMSTTNKKLKPFKTDILQLTTDELNFSLCLFVKEVKKPNGAQYAPDTIYYLCLGIQQYLFENGRIDNIFTDTYFETFTDTLDEVAKKFSELFNDHHYIVTRVEEEHLWESKQLGAHSPHVLLSTLMFFNTKHFNLTNVDEHMLLSFSHIMKHWKRNSNPLPGSGKAPGSRNVLLRFYPPQAVLDDPNSKKKKVYEQHENEENPLRCPVKLYEFYLSKCPESVRTRSDVFYLQPERSCVPDSPVWYSTMALGREPLEKMLNRVKMVKEINIALLMP